MAGQALTLTPSEGVFQANSRMRKLRQVAVRWSDLLDADITAEKASSELLKSLVNHKTLLLEVNETWCPHLIAAGAASRPDTPGYDIVAECQAIALLVDDAIATIQGTPVGSLLQGWGLDSLTWTSFTPAQTAPLKADLDAIAAEIIKNPVI